MKNTILKKFGTINIKQLDIISGQIEVLMPVEVVSNELYAVFAKCGAEYKKYHPEVINVGFDVNLIFTMGYANPEFELQIVAFDKDDEDIEKFEIYDSWFIGDIQLSEEQKRQIKKVIWNKLGETLLNL